MFGEKRIKKFLPNIAESFAVLQASSWSCSCMCSYGAHESSLLAMEAILAYRGLYGKSLRAIAILT